MLSVRPEAPLELGKGKMNFIDGSMPSYGSQHLVDLRQRENEINEAANYLPPEGAGEPDDQVSVEPSSFTGKPFGFARLFRRLWRGG